MSTENVEAAWVPVDVCTLPSVERPLRVAEFDGLFAASLRVVERPAGTRLRLVLAEDAEATARGLAGRETECCSFFTFAFHRGDARGVTMEIGVPSARVDVLDALAARATAVGGIGG